MDWIRRRIGDTSSEAAGTVRDIRDITSRYSFENYTTTRSGSEARGTPQQSVKVKYSQQGPMQYIGAGASSGTVKNQQNIDMSNSTIIFNKVSSQTSQPENIDKLDCTELKKYYSNILCKASPQLPWYTEYTWDIDEVYTELALKNSKTSKFGVEELFEQWDELNRNGSYRILITGDAGYGKSTLMLKMASDWSKSVRNNYTSRFSLLFVVKLGRVGQDGNLLNYMENIYTKKIKKMGKPLEDVLESEGAGKVLVLLDGYDEANINTKKEVDRIMERETMSNCNVVLTSRCGHVPDHVKGHALPVRVTGFGPKQVAEAVGKFFVKAGHLTEDEVRNCIDKLGPPRESDSENERDDSDSENEREDSDSENERDDSDSKNERKDSDSENVRDDAIVRSTEDVKKKDPKVLPVGQKLSLEKFSEFMGKLRAENPYKKLAQCPLLCVMMCCLVSECPNELPSTVSGLYFAMINRNLYRAARKKAEDAGKIEEKWNWDKLDNRIVKDHESYLQEFGRLCVKGLKTGRMSFKLFDITGQDRATTTDDKVTQLIEAGVLVQDTNETNPVYQVPHRTTAEFLAAYCLSRETDQNLCQNLLDLFRQRASFGEVAASLIEMGKKRCLADAFCDIRFSGDCFTNISFMKSYFTQHGAAGTWLEFKDVLPKKLRIQIKLVSSAEPRQTLLQVYEVLGKGNTRETNPVSKDCFVSVHVRGDLNPGLLQTLFKKSSVGLRCLNLKGGPKSTTESIGKVTIREVARILQDLLKSHSCPVQLSFRSITEGLIPAVTKAMKEVPKGCRLKRFDFTLAGDKCDTSPLEKVLAEKWLSHLQHLGFADLKSYRTLKPILKRLREPGCSLTSLYLLQCEIHIEDLMMLASKLETLSLEHMQLYFDVTEISKDAGKERCSLKSLRLQNVKLSLKGSLPSVDENQELLLGWRDVALNLEELTIDDCEFSIELISWLNLSLPKLRTVAIGKIDETKLNGDRQFYANQVLEALTQSSGDSIEELSLLRGFWEDENELMLHPIREALQRCPRMNSVNMGYYNLPRSAASIGPGPSTPLSPSDEEDLKSDQNALLKIVLSVPKLQTFTSAYFFDNWEEIGTFHAIADKAEKWPGKTNDNDCNTSLTLIGLSNENAVNVFRERGLEYHLRHVSEKTYEFWFPPEGCNPV